MKPIDVHTDPAGTTVIPTVRYRDVLSAIDWLCNAFGFERHRVVKDENGSVLYAQLTFGHGMVMVAPIQETVFGKLMVQPDEIGGVETQICYLFVTDAKAHQARATSLGAEIVLDIRADASAERGYSCRDPEGHIWNFGTYDPWDLQARASRPRRRAGKLRRLATVLVLACAASAIYLNDSAREIAANFALEAYARIAAGIEAGQAAQAEHPAGNAATDHALTQAREQLAKERIARLAADRHVKDIREQLAQERRSREAAELAAKDARDSQAQNQAANAALQAAENAAVQAQDELAHMRKALEIAAAQLERVRDAKDTAERANREAREQLAHWRSAKDAAERAAKDAREQAMRERSARISAERAAAQKTPAPSLFQ